MLSLRESSARDARSGAWLASGAPAASSLPCLPTPRRTENHHEGLIRTEIPVAEFSTRGNGCSREERFCDGVAAGSFAGVAGVVGLDGLGAGVDCSGGDGYAAQDGYHRGADACYSCRNGENAGDVGDDAADVLDFAEEFVLGEQARDVNVSERVAEP
jgi:hypothetical protein